MGITSQFPLGLRWFTRGGCVLVSFLQMKSFICAKKRDYIHTNILQNMSEAWINYKFWFNIQAKPIMTATILVILQMCP